MKTLMLALIFTAGCATPLLDRGGTYYIFWPGSDPDVVQIGDEVRDGWYACTSLVLAPGTYWVCNLNTALYFTRVTPTPAAQPTGIVAVQ